MEWLNDLISGIGDAISGAFESLWSSISSSIWGLFLRWIYDAIFGAIADFFIVSVFKTKELDVSDQRKASAIYISYLVGMENQDEFYNELADCFLKTTVDKDVYDLISETFLVVISEDDQSKMDNLYGKTKTRIEGSPTI